MTYQVLYSVIAVAAVRTTWFPVRFLAAETCDSATTKGWGSSSKIRLAGAGR
jgi:hypothetical protein